MTLAAVILAGGQSRRMGGADKPFCLLGGEALLTHVVRCIRPQVASVVISATGDLARFASWEFPVVPDAVGPDLGPLAGLLAGMQWAAAQNPHAEHIVSLPADVPFLPSDFVRRLLTTRLDCGADIVMASSDGRTHFMSALWPLHIAPDLQRTLSNGDCRKAETFAQRFRVATIEYDTSPTDPFFNINTPDDLVIAESVRLKALHAPDII